MGKVIEIVVISICLLITGCDGGNTQPPYADSTSVETLQLPNEVVLVNVSIEPKREDFPCFVREEPNSEKLKGDNGSIDVYVLGRGHEVINRGGVAFDMNFEVARVYTYYPKAFEQRCSISTNVILHVTKAYGNGTIGYDYDCFLNNYAESYSPEPYLLQQQLDRCVEGVAS